MDSKKEVKVTEIIDLLTDGEKLLKSATEAINIELFLEKVKKIKNSIQELEDILKKNQSSIQGYLNRMSDRTNEYSSKRLELISLNLEDVLELIKDNLPEGVTGEYENGNKLVLLLKRKKEIIKLRGKKEVIKEDVGKVIFINKEYNEIKVILKEENSKQKEDTFTLINLSRIYKIISFINNNLYYNE